MSVINEHESIAGADKKDNESMCYKTLNAAVRH